MQFATCEPHRAFEYLGKELPLKRFNKKTMPKLFEALNADIVRITDPMMHRLALIGGNNYKDEHRSLMQEINAEINNAPTKEAT